MAERDCELPQVLTGCLVGLLLGANLTMAQWNHRETRRLEWTDPAGRRPTCYREWAARYADLDAGRIGETGLSLSLQGANDRNLSCDRLVDVVVNADLYHEIMAELSQYTADLYAAGYSVRIDTMRGMNHVQLKQHLAGITGLVGVLLVGELPVAWYEDDWGGSAPEEFPIDLYFMDLNGTWTDTDGDGLYDSHAGNRAPEIWVGRLNARPLTWDDEVRLVRRYFAKNHLYRTGGLVLPDRGLSFVDDDWVGTGAAYLNLVYSECVVVEDRDSSCANNYRRQLLQGYEWIHVMSHSSPWGHTFRVPAAGYTGTVFNCEIWAIRPRAHFYNLFACSGARYVEENYSAGWDILHDDWGLTALGSTKTGSMLGFQYFYGPLSRDSCIGDALKRWFIVYGLSDPDWFYGMAIVGDPTLKPHNNGCDGGRASKQAGQSQEPGSSPEVVAPHPETDDSPSLLATPEGRIWAVWKSGRNPSNGRFDIFAAWRENGVWSDACNVGSAYYWETDPCLGLDIDWRPVAVWSTFTGQYHYNLYWSMWDGRSWTPAAELAEDPSSDLQPIMARDSSGILWCFYASRQDLWADIWATSFDGSGWSTPMNITADTATQVYPRSAVMPDGTVWVVYSQFTDGTGSIGARYRSGNRWIETGSVCGTQRRAFRPAIAVGDSGLPIVCWHSFDSGDGEIWFSQWTGSNWAEPQLIEPVPGADLFPVLASDPRYGVGYTGVVWLVWMSDRAGMRGIYYACRSGSVWSRAVRAAQSTGHNINPAVAVDRAGSAFAVWQNLTDGNWDIHCSPLEPVGIGDAGRRVTCPSAGPSFCQRYLRVEEPGVLLDISGRKVLNLIRGDNILKGLTAGVHFVVQPNSPGRLSEVRKVIVGP